MERKNAKEGAVVRRVDRAIAWTFCLALAAAIMWGNYTPDEGNCGIPKYDGWTGSQAIPQSAVLSRLRAFPEGQSEPAPAEDQNPEDEAVADKATLTPSAITTASDIPVNKPQTAGVPPYLKRGERFHPLIVRVSREHNVDPALVKAIIMAESGYNPQAVSKVGAGGLMQLMPQTADSLGVQDIFDPEENVSGGVKYLKQLLNEFGGEIKLALAAYNAGSRKVKTCKGVPPIGATHAYINKVIEYYQHYRKRLTGPKGNA
jgi:soluble lytic murein transglycosylase-like protein